MRFVLALGLAGPAAIRLVVLSWPVIGPMAALVGIVAAGLIAAAVAIVPRAGTPLMGRAAAALGGAALFWMLCSLTAFSSGLQLCYAPLEALVAWMDPGVARQGEALFTPASAGGRRLAGPYQHVGPVSWSPDGRLLLFFGAEERPYGEPSHEHLYAVWTDSRRTTQILGDHLDRDTLYNAPARLRTYWSPDGTQIAVVDGNNLRVTLVTLSSMEKRDLGTTPPDWWPVQSDSLHSGYWAGMPPEQQAALRLPAQGANAPFRSSSGRFSVEVRPAGPASNWVVPLLVCGLVCPMVMMAGARGWRAGERHGVLSLFTSAAAWGVYSAAVASDALIHINAAVQEELRRHPLM